MGKSTVPIPAVSPLTWLTPLLEHPPTMHNKLDVIDILVTALERK
jgi:hypothetical protein